MCVYFSRNEEYCRSLQAAKVLKPVVDEWLVGCEGSASCRLESGGKEGVSGQSEPNSQHNYEQAECVESTATTNGGSVGSSGRGRRGRRGGRGGAKV